MSTIATKPSKPQSTLTSGEFIGWQTVNSSKTGEQFIFATFLTKEGAVIEAQHEGELEEGKTYRIVGQLSKDGTRYFHRVLILSRPKTEVADHSGI